MRPGEGLGAYFVLNPTATVIRKHLLLSPPPFDFKGRAYSKRLMTFI